MEELIAKKELLEQMNISYGQLYRWKRKNIIPEEWFIKKAVASGQETYFPKEKILERISFILNTKDGVSLDEMAKMLNHNIDNIIINMDNLVNKKILTEESIERYKQMVFKSELTTLQECIGAKLYKDYVINSEITVEEGRMVDAFIANNFEGLLVEEARVYILRHMGMPMVIGVKDKTQVIWDTTYKVILEISLFEQVRILKRYMMD